MQKIAEEQNAFDLPDLTPLAGPAVSRTDPADFKIRKKRAPQIVLVKHEEAEEGIPAALKDLALASFYKQLAFQDVSWIDSNLPLLPVTEASARSFLKENAADAVAHVKIKKSSEKALLIELKLLDPYSGALFAELSQDYKIHARTIDQSHQQDIAMVANQYYFLTNATGQQLEAIGPRPPAALREMLMTAVTGKLNISSSAASTEVYLLQGKDRPRKLGNTPIQNLPLDEGEYALRFTRKGYKPIDRPLLVRAGKVENIIVPWPDDPVSYAAVIFSSPPELQVSFDGSVRGETPAFLTGIDRGTYSMEFARLNPKANAYEVVGEAELNVDQAETHRAFFLNHQEKFAPDLLSGDLWQAVTEKGSFAFKGNGFALVSQTKERWAGISTIPFFIDSYDFKLGNIESDGGRLLWILQTRGDTIAVEVYGKVYRAIHKRDGKVMAETQGFKTLLPLPENQHFIRMQYNKEKQLLRIKVDGSVIYEGEYRPAAEGRMQLLTKGDSADGRVLASSLFITSGRGRLDGKLLDLPFLDDFVDFFMRR